MQHAIQPDEAANLAEYIGLVRERAGISQSELARRSGIDQTTVSRIESGAVTPTPDRLSRLAEALQVNSGDLFGLAGYTRPTDLPSLPVYLRTKYGQHLTDEQRRELRAWLDQTKEDNNP